MTRSDTQFDYVGGNVSEALPIGTRSALWICWLSRR